MQEPSKSIFFEKGERSPISELERSTQIQYSSELIFESDALKEKIRAKIKKRHRKGDLTKQQMWFGAYFLNEIQSPKIPEVEIRYIDPILGWGVFANRDFEKMEWIAQYSGLVRKYRRRDAKNAYCFEYTLANGVKTPYTIDAQERGGIARFVNHSVTPNLISALATVDFVNHVILITKEKILKGTQLCYDYGPSYWSRREKPEEIPL